MSFHLVFGSFTIGGTLLSGSTGRDNQANNQYRQKSDDDFFHIFDR